MVRRYPVFLVVLVSLVIAQVAVAAQSEEQQELLAWAKTLRYQARIDQAMAVCEMIVADDPECLEAWVEHGMLALSEEQMGQAVASVREVLTREPRHKMALVLRGHASLVAGERDRAMEDAAVALRRCNHEIDVGASDARTWYVRGLARMLLQDDRALQDFATAISLDPTLMDARGERAHIYRAKGRMQSAIDELTRAAELRPDYAVGYLSRARMHYEQGDMDASVADCDRALEINPEYAQAWHNRGVVNFERGQFETAVDDLTQAIAADPDYASAYVYRGQANQALGHVEAARADWEAARRLAPEGWAGEAAGKMLRELGVSGG